MNSTLIVVPDMNGIIRGKICRFSSRQFAYGNQDNKI
jgi:hypothetical protein